jgi:hypothetical protein
VPQGAAQAAATAANGGRPVTTTANLGGPVTTKTADTKDQSAAGKAGEAMGKLIGETVGSQGGSAVSQFVGGFVDGLAKGLEQSLGNFCPGEPSPEDKKPPSKPTQLNVDSNGVVTTPGGYKIEATSQYTWKITGPDGSSSEIWGDPHVRQRDAKGNITANWDFKKDSTFVLADGTKINVQCKPYGNMTVTSAIEIWRDGEEVDITDIDKGKGKVGKVQVNANEDFATQQTFMEGLNASDWLFGGFQITGNTAEGADHFARGQFELGEWGHNHIGGWGGNYGNGIHGLNNNSDWLNGPGAAKPPSTQPAPNPAVDRTAALLKILTGVLELVSALAPLLKSQARNNPYSTPDQAPPKTTTPPKYDSAQHAQGLKNAFSVFGTMFQVLGQVLQMAAELKGMRAQGAR